MPSDTTRTSNAPDPRSGQPNTLVFWGFLAVGALVSLVFLVRFSGLLTNPVNLAPTILTPIAIGLALGLQFSGLARRLPSLTVNGVRAVSAILIALDLFVSGGAGHDTAPAFVSTATTAPSTHATATTAPAATTLTGAFDHRVSVDTVAGNGILGKTSDGKVVLCFEKLNSANGPDLHVYLSKQVSPATTQQVMDGVEVGKLRATQGTSNYELATTTDSTQFKSVVIYCKSFAVVFGYANLR
jgi:hypothetical protein